MPKGRYKMGGGGKPKTMNAGRKANGSITGLMRSSNKTGIHMTGGKIMGAAGKRGYQVGLTHKKGGNRRTYKESDTYGY